MSSETEPSLYQCDCGYVAHFLENTVKEVKQRSLAKRQWLSEGDGIQKHIVVFEGGKMTMMLCPEQGRHETRARYTSKQGRYLAFIHHYTTLHGVPPAEHEIQEFFRVSPPTVHQMILTLEKKVLIQRTPGEARSIKVLVPVQQLPRLT
jgi:repressor LexA